LGTPNLNTRKSKNISKNSKCNKYYLKAKQNSYQKTWQLTWGIFGAVLDAEWPSLIWKASFIFPFVKTVSRTLNSTCCLILHIGLNESILLILIDLRVNIYIYTSMIDTYIYIISLKDSFDVMMTPFGIDMGP
jgi:hypothetical protein